MTQLEAIRTHMTPHQTLSFEVGVNDLYVWIESERGAMTLASAVPLDLLDAAPPDAILSIIANLNKAMQHCDGPVDMLVPCGHLLTNPSKEVVPPSTREWCLAHGIEIP